MTKILVLNGNLKTIVCRSGNSYTPNSSGFIINPLDRDIGDLINAGCIFSQWTERKVSTGSSDVSLVTDSVISWESSTVSAKTQSIAFQNANMPIMIVDSIGTALTYPITISSTVGTINDSATFVLNQNNASATLVWDGISNFSVV